MIVYAYPCSARNRCRWAANSASTVSRATTARKRAVVPSALGRSSRPEPLGFLLARAEGAGDLDGDLRTGQVDGEVGHLADHQQIDLPGPERLVQPLPLADRRSGR